jgi:tetratricopeptide (TPR) repeat protein
MVRSTVAVIGSLISVAAGIASDPPRVGENGAIETTSLLGRKLYALEDSDGAIGRAKAALAARSKECGLSTQACPAQAAKRQYKEAVTTCEEGLQYASQNADLYLEKGHRELGLRDFKQGLADLSEAVQLDPRNLDAQYHLWNGQLLSQKFQGSGQQLSARS